MVDRRGFLSSFAGAASVAATLGLHGELFAQLAQAPRQLPDKSLYTSNEETYWAELRKQFLIPEDEDLSEQRHGGLEPGAGAARHLRGLHRDREAGRRPIRRTIRSGATRPWNEFRDPLAAFVGCTRDEIALVRNATEANSYIANGIDMKAGDEVLMTDQEHPGGEQPWHLRAKRYGIVVKKITLPKPVPDAAQVLNLFSDAITPRTRVMFFSHITTVTGVVLPAKELCALARSKGILSAVDGAHVPGMMKLNLHDLGLRHVFSRARTNGCRRPKGSGFLYVRDEVIDRMWNTMATEGWDDPKIRAERFQRIGIVERAGAVGLARVDRAGQRHRHGAHRKTAPPDRRTTCWRK